MKNKFLQMSVSVLIVLLMTFYPLSGFAAAYNSDSVQNDTNPVALKISIMTMTT